jgi:hypothetical protein
MGRFLWGLALILLFLIPLPGLNLFNNVIFALEHSSQIKGKVIDSASKASIEYANISLFLLPDTVPIQFATTDLKGEFSFSNLSPGNYAIVVHFMGFKNHKTQPFTLSAESVKKLEPIPIEIENIALREINVSAKSGKPVYQGGKKTITLRISFQGQEDLLRIFCVNFPL